MRKLNLILPLALLLCFVAGCQDKEAMAELEAFKAQAALEEQNKELIRNFFIELDKQNFEIYIEVFAPDGKIFFPSNSSVPMSSEQAALMVKSFYEAFPDFSHNIEELDAVGDKVILRTINKGTHQGEFNGIPATESKVEFSTILIWYIKEGKVVELRQEADIVGFYQKLGMELKPKEGEK